MRGTQHLGHDKGVEALVEREPHLVRRAATEVGDRGQTGGDLVAPGQAPCVAHQLLPDAPEFFDTRLFLEFRECCESESVFLPAFALPEFFELRVLLVCASSSSVASSRLSSSAVTAQEVAVSSRLAA